MNTNGLYNNSDFVRVKALLCITLYYIIITHGGIVTAYNFVIRNVIDTVYTFYHKQ